jgi:hypothetical protein
MSLFLDVAIASLLGSIIQYFVTLSSFLLVLVQIIDCFLFVDSRTRWRLRDQRPPRELIVKSDRQGVFLMRLDRLNEDFTISERGGIWA